MMKIFFTVLVVLLSMASPALADQLSDLKQAGIIGEGNDGYLAAVKPNPAPEALQLINSVNAARKAEYQKIAAKNGQSLDVVAKLTAVKLAERTESGNFVMDDSRQWIKK